MAPAPARTNFQDPFLGRKDMVLHIERTLKQLFPQPTDYPYDDDENSLASSSQTTLIDEGDLPSLREWLAYMLYRTNLPNSTIFHALHLLRRISMLPDSHYPISPIFTPSHPLNYFAWSLTSFIICTNYVMDEAFSNKSWCIASKDLFTVPEITDMQFDMFSSLGWALRAEGEDLLDILEDEEMYYLEEIEIAKREKRKRKEKILFAEVEMLGKKMGRCFPGEGATPTEIEPPTATVDFKSIPTMATARQESFSHQPISVHT